MDSPAVAVPTRTTPPSFTVPKLGYFKDQIEEALAEGCLPMLELTLLCGHCCPKNHSVHEAVRRRHIEALDFLLRQGAACADEPCDGRRPLSHALRACTCKGDVGYRMAELLLRHNARPGPSEGDLVTADGPLHDAARRGVPAAVELLLANGADPNLRDAKGFTPLHAICQANAVGLPGAFLAPILPEAGQPQPRCCEASGYTEALDALLEHGACPFQPDSLGLQPHQYTRDDDLKRRLARARQWWQRRALALACRRQGAGTEACKADGEALKTPSFPPEIYSFIASFV